MLLRISSKIILMMAMLFTNAALAQVVDDCEAVPGAFTNEDFKLADGVTSSRPESIQRDKKRGFWYVSNQGIPTNPTDGFISRLHPDGTMETFQWVTGLGHPSGIRIFEDELYVADRDHTANGNSAIVVIDLETGTIVKTYLLSASLLNCAPGVACGPNDPAVDFKTDAIYVSSFSQTAGQGNRVLKVPLSGDGSDATSLGTPGTFLQPNGTLIYKHDLIVMNSDGRFLRINLDTGNIELLGSTSFMPPGGVLDGVERLGGKLLFTKNGGQNTGRESLFASIRFQSGPTPKEERLCTLPGDPPTGTDVGGTADLGIDYDSGVVAIPHLFGGKITFFNLDEFFEMSESP